MRRPPAWLLTAALGIVYLAVAPPSADLAAHAYRAGLVERAGWAAWNNGWFAGHHTLGYSVLGPPLMAVLGVHLTAALAATGAAAAFERLVAGARRSHPDLRGQPGSVPPGARIAALAFAAIVGAHLFTGRATFILGVAAGLAAALAAARGRPATAAILAAITTLTSPVAGLFAGVAGVSAAAAASPRGGAARPWIALAAGAAIPAVALAVAFPQQGTEPFVASAFWPALGAALAVAALAPPRHRALRLGALLYAALLTAAFAVPTPLGGNATRLGALLAGPALAAAAWEQRRWAVLVLAPAFAYWALYPPVRDTVRAAGDPAAEAAYHEPLVAFLADRRGAPFRVEAVPTADHGEARFVAPHVPLARGWERQTDRAAAGLFYEDRLDPAAYRRWLDARAVRYVALPTDPDVPIDEGGASEARLLRERLPAWLTPVWRTPDWTVFEVRDAQPLTRGPARVTALGGDRIRLEGRRPGTTTVQLRWSPYWAVVEGAGCVRRAPGGWTQVDAATHALTLGIRLTPTRVRATSARCT